MGFSPTRGLFSPTRGFCSPPRDGSRCHQSPPGSQGGRMQREAGGYPAPSRVPALRAGPGARSQNRAVGIWCVYLQSSADPGTGRRMSQLPVQDSSSSGLSFRLKRAPFGDAAIKSFHQIGTSNSPTGCNLRTPPLLVPSGTESGRAPKPSACRNNRRGAGVRRRREDGAQVPEGLRAPPAAPKAVTHIPGVALAALGGSGGGPPGTKSSPTP